MPTKPGPRAGRSEVQAHIGKKSGIAGTSEGLSSFDMNGAFHDFLSALARVSIQVFVGAHIRIHCWDSPCFLAVSKMPPLAAMAIPCFSSIQAFDIWHQQQQLSSLPVVCQVPEMNVLNSNLSFATHNELPRMLIQPYG